VEHDEPTPRHSGLRPPNGPPTNTAIGFSPESDGDDAFNYFKHLASKEADILDREIEGELLSEALQLHKEHALHPEYLKIQQEYFLKLRQDIEDQIALELIVQRPQRADRLPGSGGTGLVEAHEKTLAAIDDMLAALKRVMEGDGKQ